MKKDVTELYGGVYEGFDQKHYIELMQNVAVALDKLVDYCEEMGIDIQDFICDGYPFEHSLDEVACEVSGWVETARDILKEKEA